MAPSPQPADPRAYLTDPWTGEVSRVGSSSERRAAMAGGLVAASPEDIKKKRYEEKYDKPGLAALAGALRGGTFGLSDILAVRSGAVDAETLRGLEDVNPVWTGAGDVAGTIGSLAFGPGKLIVGGAAKAGAAVSSGASRAAFGANVVRRSMGVTARQVIAPGAAKTAAKTESLLAYMAAPPKVGFGADIAGSAVREGLVGGAIGYGQATSRIALSPEELSAQQVLEKLADGTKQGATVFAGLGVGMRVLGKGTRAAQKYLGRGLEDLEAAQGTMKAVEANLQAAEAVAGDPFVVQAARAELEAAQKGVAQAEQALASAKSAEMLGVTTEESITATGVLKKAQERAIVAAERAEVAAASPTQTAISAAQERMLPAQEALATAEAAFANKVTGRAMGLGLAYYMGGGVGLQALGFMMGPRMMKYVNRIAGRMQGPIGGVVRDVQDAFKPEIIQYAKWPLERAIGGYATGGPVGAAVQLGLGRLEEAVGVSRGRPILAAVDSMFKNAPQKAGLNITQWVTDQAKAVASTGKTFSADATDWTDKKIKAFGEIDLPRMEAGLFGSLNPDIPDAVAQEAVAKVVDVMAYLQEVNPANIYPEGKIPRAATAKFKAKLSTVVDPEVFFKALAEGRLSPGSPEVEAMRRAYPGAMQQLQGIFQAAVTKTYALGGTVERKYLKNLQAIGVKVSTPKQYNPARERYLLSLVEPTQPGPKPRPRPITGAAKASATQSQRLQRGQ